MLFFVYTTLIFGESNVNHNNEPIEAGGKTREEGNDYIESLVYGPLSQKLSEVLACPVDPNEHPETTNLWNWKQVLKYFQVEMSSLAKQPSYRDSSVFTAKAKVDKGKLSQSLLGRLKAYNSRFENVDEKKLIPFVDSISLSVEKMQKALKSCLESEKKNTPFCVDCFSDKPKQVCLNDDKQSSRSEEEAIYDLFSKKGKTASDFQKISNKNLNRKKCRHQTQGSYKVPEDLHRASLYPSSSAPGSSVPEGSPSFSDEEIPESLDCGATQLEGLDIVDNTRINGVNTSFGGKNGVFRSPQDIRYIKIDSSAATQSGESLARASNSKSNPFGYHYIIDKDGTIRNTAHPLQVTQGLSSSQRREFFRQAFNSNTLHISLAGTDNDKDGKNRYDKSKPHGTLDSTPAQKAALKKLYVALMQKFPAVKDNVFGHGEVSTNRHRMEGAREADWLRKKRIDCTKGGPGRISRPSNVGSSRPHYTQPPVTSHKTMPRVTKVKKEPKPLSGDQNGKWKEYRSLQEFKNAEISPEMKKLLGDGALPKPLSMGGDRGFMESVLGISTLEDAQRAITQKDKDGNTAVRSYTTDSGKTLFLHNKIAGNVLGFINELESLGYNLSPVLPVNNPLDGSGNLNDYKSFIHNQGTVGYQARPQVTYVHPDGTAEYGTRLSTSQVMGSDFNMHVNPHSSKNKFHTNLPPGVDLLAAKWGLIWGGNWNRVKDTQNFEYHSHTGVKAMTLDEYEKNQRQPL